MAQNAKKIFEVQVGFIFDTSGRAYITVQPQVTVRFPTWSAVLLRMELILTALFADTRLLDLKCLLF